MRHKLRRTLRAQPRLSWFVLHHHEATGREEAPVPNSSSPSKHVCRPGLYLPRNGQPSIREVPGAIFSPLSKPHPSPSSPSSSHAMDLWPLSSPPSRTALSNPALVAVHDPHAPSAPRGDGSSSTLNWWLLQHCSSSWRMLGHRPYLTSCPLQRWRFGSGGSLGLSSNTVWATSSLGV